MKICFVSFPLDRNLKAQTELVDRYGNCSPEDADYIVALGGDGFILKSLHDYLKINKPIFGMNFGSVGFLMNEYSIDNLDSRLAKAQLTKLRPLVMKTLTPTGQEVKAIAINEISIRRERYQAAKLKVIIDDEIRFLAEEAEKVCKKILQDNIEQLHIVAKGLLEYETLSGNEINDLIKGIKPSRDDFDNTPTPNPTPKTSVPKTGGTTAPQTN